VCGVRFPRALPWAILFQPLGLRVGNSKRGLLPLSLRSITWEWSPKGSNMIAQGNALGNGIALFV
jgi:hypothetical protein